MAIALVGGTLIDGNGGAPVPNTTVLVEGQRVSRIGSAAQVSVPAGAKVINAAGKTVMPGLIDGHIHICGETSVDVVSRPHVQLRSYVPIRGVAAARKLLDMGFTACRAMADVDYASVALREAIEVGLVPGPRMLVSAYMLGIVAGGANGYIPPDKYKTDPGMFTGPQDARRAVRQNLLNGADFIETMVGGRVGSNAPTLPEDSEWSVEELEAAADEAHRRGKRISANCYSDETIEMCVKAGFDIIEHGCLVTERGIEVMVKHGVYMVPTLAAYNAYLGSQAERHYPAYRLARGRRIASVLREKFPKYVQLGLKVAGGSDGSGPGVGRRAGEGALELQLMMDYGMTPMQSIVANTKVCADVMGALKDLGTVEPGKLADIIVVGGDPLADIRILQQREKLQVVMKGGEVFRSDLRVEEMAATR